MRVKHFHVALHWWFDPFLWWREACRPKSEIIVGSRGMLALGKTRTWNEANYLSYLPLESSSCNINLTSCAFGHFLNWLLTNLLSCQPLGVSSISMPFTNCAIEVRPRHLTSALWHQCISETSCSKFIVLSIWLRKCYSAPAASIPYRSVLLADWLRTVRFHPLKLILWNRRLFFLVQWSSVFYTDIPTVCQNQPHLRLQGRC